MKETRKKYHQKKIMLNKTDKSKVPEGEREGKAHVEAKATVGKQACP